MKKIFHMITFIVNQFQLIEKYKFKKLIGPADFTRNISRFQDNCKLGADNHRL